MKEIDKVFLRKSFNSLGVFLLCSFFSPVILHQAFKNKDHYLFLPVLIFGLVFFVIGIIYGFKGIKNLLIALIGKKKN
jgi:predicted membrane channel-forming protein YqfA (hemolysin III family)